MEWRSLLTLLVHATFVCLFVCASPHDAVGLVVADHRKPKNGETHVWLHGSRFALEVARLMGTANYLNTSEADWSAGTPLCTATKPAAAAFEIMAVDSDDDSAIDAVTGVNAIGEDDDADGVFEIEDSEDGANSATGPELINARAALRKIHDGMLGWNANTVRETPGDLVSRWKAAGGVLAMGRLTQQDDWR